MNNKKASVTVFSLVMLITGAVDGIGNLPSIAIFGPQLVFFFVVAVLLFLLPTGLISAELCAQFKEDGGVYHWGKRAFGSHFSLLVVWLQWINTMVWFPTCMTTLAGTMAYFINPALAHSPAYLVMTSLTVFWVMTWLNLKGISHSARIASLATMVGMVIPMALIISLSIFWVTSGKPVVLKLASSTLLPHFTQLSTWTSLTAIITAFLGMELATVHVKKIHNARKIFPKALICSIILIVFTLGVGSLGITMVIPHQDIVLVTGTIQAFKVLFNGLHLQWLEMVLAAMLVFGSLGTMVNWLISPANGLAQSAHDNYLPNWFTHENSHGVPARILILQSIVVSAVSSAFFLMPDVNSAYWLLLDLSTELYVIMYFLMFITAIKLLLNAKKIILIPGGKTGAFLMIFAGLIGCVNTLIIGFFPPSNIGTVSKFHFFTVFSGGLLLMTCPVALLYFYKFIRTRISYVSVEAVV